MMDANVPKGDGMLQVPKTDGMLQVLLAEQKHIDTQIETMMDLQITILAFLFPTLAVAGAWISGIDEKVSLADQGKGEVLLVLVVVMCFGILLSTICYNVSAEYSRYKTEVLCPRFQRLLDSSNLLDGRSWGRSDIGRALSFAITLLWTTVSAALVIALGTLTALLWATRSVNSSFLFRSHVHVDPDWSRSLGPCFLGHSTQAW